MLQLDPEDPDDDENAPKVLTALASTNANPQLNQPDAASSIITEADQVILENYKVRSTNFKMNILTTMIICFQLSYFFGAPQLHVMKIKVLHLVAKNIFCLTKPHNKRLRLMFITVINDQ